MTASAKIDLDAPLTETPDPYGAFPRLTDEQIRTLGTEGERRPVRAGEVLYAQGGQPSEFFVILRGRVAVTEGTGDDTKVVRVHGPRRFLGELGLLEGQPAFVGAVAADPGEVLAIPVSALRHLVLGDPVLGDLILRAYLVRRTLLIGSGNGPRIVGSCYSPDTRRLLEFVARNRLPYRLVDVDKDQQAEALLRRFGVAVADTPVVVVNGTEVLRNPSTAELAGKIGLRPPEPERGVRDLLVVGAGARWAGRGGLRRVRRVAVVGVRCPGPGRPGRDDVPHRELPRLPAGDLRRGTGRAVGDPGGQVRGPGRRAGQGAHP